MNNFKEGMYMETMKQWERKRWMRKIRNAITKGFALLFIAIACIALSFGMRDVCKLVTERPIYPEEEYANMEEFAKKVIHSNVGIDEETLNLKSEYDFEYVFSQDAEGNPQKTLKLTSDKDNKLSDPMTVTVWVDEAYHIISIRRDTTEEMYAKEYYKWQGFKLLLILFLVYMTAFIAYTLWKV